MSATFERGLSGAPRRTPRRIAWPPLIALVLVSLVGLIALLPTVHEDPVHVVATRSLRVDAADDGRVVLSDADTGAVAGTVEAGGESFIRGILHGSAISRRQYGVDQLLPYRLTALSDGRLTLTDDFTHITIDLVSFGPTNARSFAMLLGAPAQETR